ncbi:type II secretion system F family protein [Yoonia sp. 2307UL14-13]|uniref:type II secretion system F family protein n=1 Tax=Yoonia sp. 2307UL14-13 TaxID=3126506 RepID=UPI0030A3801D
MPEAARSDLIPFDYAARDAAGGRKKGRITARDDTDAAKRLRAEGLYPIEIRAARPASVAKEKPRRVSGQMSARQRAAFVSRLAKLTGSQISLDRALAIMADGDDGAIAGRAGALRVHMREGGGFADGLQQHLGLDDAATQALVRGAEISGDMADALATAAGILEQRLMLTRRIMTGLLYPSLLLVVAIISVGLIMIAIIPQFRPLVEDRMDAIPVLGRAIFAISATLTAIWPILVGGMLIGGFALWILHRRGRAVPILQTFSARLPVISGVIVRNQVMIVLYILAAMLRREVTLSEALRVVTNTAPGGRVRAAVDQVSSEVETGQPLSSSLRAANIMPSAAVEMIRIGEETGDLPGMIGRAAAEMRETADRELERFLALFQPALIVIVGLLVGVSLYALFSAIVSVNAISF